MLAGTRRAPNSALKRACYVLRFMLADRPDIRKRFYRRAGRVVLIDQREYIFDLPYYHILHSKYTHVPGLGATISIPISSARVENVMCHETDTSTDDILMRVINKC